MPCARARTSRLYGAAIISPRHAGGRCWSHVRTIPLAAPVSIQVECPWQARVRPAAKVIASLATRALRGMMRRRVDPGS